jgi:hypothetical protein
VRPESRDRPARRHVVLVYTAARITVFVLVLAGFAVIGLAGPGLILLALLVSGLLSFVLLSRQRIAMAEAIQRRTAQRDRPGIVRRLQRRVADTQAAEDAYVEQLRRRTAAEPDTRDESG